MWRLVCVYFLFVFHTAAPSRSRFVCRNFCFQLQPLGVGHLHTSLWIYCTYINVLLCIYLQTPLQLAVPHYIMYTPYTIQYKEQTKNQQSHKIIITLKKENRRKSKVEMRRMTITRAVPFLRLFCKIFFYEMVMCVVVVVWDGISL